MPESAQPDPSDPRAHGLSHVGAGSGGPEARMVDVGEKEESDREALAEAWLRFPPGLLEGLLAEGGPKGPILEVARVAGIQGAKRTGELIPMCHPLGLEHVELRFEPRLGGPGEEDRLRVTCRTRCRGKTGVEMEALTGAALAALCVYDMTKAVARETVVEGMRLLRKTGGKSGVWEASQPPFG